MTDINETGITARAAARQLGRATTDQKNQALLRLADVLSEARSEILAANAVDLSATAELTAAFVDRMTLNAGRILAMAEDLRQVAALPDPVGERFDQTILPNGLKLHKQRVPLGVLGVIYESRPNVTVDVAGLAIKTGNAVILRGGKETLATNRALVNVVQRTLQTSGMPAGAVQFIDDPDRARMLELLQLQEYVDLIIPRGGNALHQFCRDNSRIPVITGGMGICHIFVDETADLGKALDVIRNSKITKPSACNSLDVVLVHRNIADRFLPALVRLLTADGVVFRVDETAFPLLQEHATGATAIPPDNVGDRKTLFGSQAGPHGHEMVTSASPGDFDTEWLALILSLRVVSGLDEAVDHINDHSQHHSDSILTASDENARRFVAEVDSAAVYVNASTRFTDGAQFGLGAEVAISTQRLHARGPMGLREITTYKWVVEGDYHLRL